LKNTGFSEIKEERLYYKGDDPWYIEVALTGSCNFNCKYCNRFSETVDYKKIKTFFHSFSSCKHVQITGGEPTLHKNFEDIIYLCREKSNTIGLSTNGTYGLQNYLKLPIDMFSISLDDYNIDVLIERGYKNPVSIIKTIRELSKYRYVNVGVVIDSINISRINDIIKYIIDLGVDDIKLSTSTHDDVIPKIIGDFSSYPILNYRVNNFNNNNNMRGFPAKKCYIIQNDITIVGDKHYPCLVYFREKGKEIGQIDDNIIKTRKDFFKEFNPQEDPICQKYCMDFKCEFNESACLIYN